MCLEEDGMSDVDSGVTHLDIRDEMRKQFRWFLGILFAVLIPLGGGFTSQVLKQQEQLGQTNAKLAVVTENLTASIERQNVLDIWMEERRSEVTDIMRTITQNQMTMTEKLHNHELNGEHK